MNNIKVSAPGKLHLLGEHTIVYNKPAILTAVNKRCFIQISTRDDNKLNVLSKSYKKDLTLSFDDIVEKFNKAQADWDKYDASNNIPLLKSITKDPLDYPFIIVGQFINNYDLKTLPGFELVIDSEIPVGAGMGSSGALAVSIIGALSLFADKPFDKKTINDIAYLCEKKKHGKPSGGDNSTSCYGGLVWFKKDEGLKALDADLPKDVSSNFYTINTGTPTETTGEMVGLVHRLVEKDPESMNAILDDQEKLVHDLLPALENEKHEEIIEIIRKGEANLEKLGVVSDYVKEIIRKIESCGGAAKICGAGGTTKSTGIILIYIQNIKDFKTIMKNYNLQITKILIAEEGLKVDE
jgi:mevalonate kinase